MEAPLYETHSDVTPDVPPELTKLASFKTEPEPHVSEEVKTLKRALKHARADARRWKNRTRRLREKLNKIEGVLNVPALQDK